MITAEITIGLCLIAVILIPIAIETKRQRRLDKFYKGR